MHFETSSCYSLYRGQEVAEASARILVYDKPTPPFSEVMPLGYLHAMPCGVDADLKEVCEYHTERHQVICITPLGFDDWGQAAATLSQGICTSTT
jgi:hypothetical protein